MNCELVLVRQREDGRYVHRCQRCESEFASRTQMPKANCRQLVAARARPTGPGQCLLSLFRSHGIPAKSGCTCQALAAEMDRLGVAGCRQQRADLLAKIASNWKHYTWSETVGAGLRLATQPWFRITDPLGSCFDEAVRLAEINPPFTSLPPFPREPSA